MADANGAGEGPPNRARRDELVAIQREAQAAWAQERVFEVDAPDEGSPDAEQARYTANFPYPYMNGVLHVGHAFSLSKVEFATAYHRLCGKRTLFPQGFHCTGMPIKACADKLKGEIEQYGCPPAFPEPPPPTEAELAAAAAKAAAEARDPTKFGGKKSKAAAKQGTAATQWGILASTGIPEAEIPRFSDSMHWLTYFPPLAMRDISALGCGVDWRRSFITTDVNPFYDAFVRWQFNTLRKQGRITKAKRYSVYSPKDGQPCADHDRASGEGAVPQEYTLVKLRALALPGALAPLEGQGPVFLMAATLRPETMAGQTNCWALPDGDYGAYRGLGGEVYVMTARAARNLAFQDRSPQAGVAELLLPLKGQDLIGVPLKAPCSPYERVYVLPLLTISTGKGTGIVTSVPSDSPDDWAALADLKKKPKLREKYGVADEWVLPFEIVPIIEIPGFGDRAAERVCADLKVQSQNDRAKLEEAKKLVYLKGFTDGVMVTGPYAGEKVSECKDKHKRDLLAAGEGLLYSEPERPVTSRSGDECVVALTDQWYLDYGEAGWLAAVRRGLEATNLYSEDARRQFQHVLGWLHEWACSRSFGLGSRVPWDPAFLIESLSDSTVYMAYYTVAHLLQNGDIFGKTGGGVAAEDLTDEVWDYVFLDGPLPAGGRVPEALLRRMRREFDYWYPFDLRASGKDLIQNHLTFCLYNHAAIWQDRPDRWPRSIRCNGHLMLNSEKMSKSTGNFLTLGDAVAEFGADAVRMALADAGDMLDDANFESSVANSAILRLTKELAWIEEVVAALPAMRDDQRLFCDRVFANDINHAVHLTQQAYDGMLFREALKHGCYELQKARDAWRVAVGPHGLDGSLVQRYIEVSTLLLAPLCPHTCWHIWGRLLRKPGSVLAAGWPVAPPADPALLRAAAYIDRVKDRLGAALHKEAAPKKGKKGAPPAPPAKVTGVEFFVARSYSGWQATVLQHLQSRWREAERDFAPGTLGAPVVEAVRAAGTAGDLPQKALMGQCIPFARGKHDEALAAGPEALSAALPFDEAALLEENAEYLQSALKLESVRVGFAEAGAAGGRPAEAARAEPGAPAIVLLREQR